MLLLTDEDDFNALASVLLADCVDGRVYRLAPPQRSHGVVAPYTGGEIGCSFGRTGHGVGGPEPNWAAGCGVRAVAGAAIRRCRHPVRNARP